MPSSLRAFAIGVICVGGRASAVAVTSRTGTLDDLPTVQVKLAPPKQALPEVAAEVGSLDHDRENMESDLMTHLTAVYDATLADAKTRIDHLVASSLHTSLKTSHTQPLAVGFLRKQSRDFGEGFGIKLNLISIPPPDASIQFAIEKIESKRALEEKTMFQQASAEMQGLTSIVLNDLGSALARRATAFRSTSSQSLPVGFLQTVDGIKSSSRGLPARANVRIAAADDAFPRVSDLIQDMEMRRDQSENQERAAILELELKLLRAENEIIQQSLSR